MCAIHGINTYRKKIKERHNERLKTVKIKMCQKRYKTTCESCCQIFCEHNKNFALRAEWSLFSESMYKLL